MDTNEARPGLSNAAVMVAALLAVDPHALGGALVRARPGPQRDVWLQSLRTLCADQIPVRRIPVHVTSDRLLGGLDLAATLAAGRPVAERGLLVDADGGIILLAGAERLDGHKAQLIATALGRGAVTLERDGFSGVTPARFGVIAIDESCADDEAVSGALIERLAFQIDLDTLEPLDSLFDTYLADRVGIARKAVGNVSLPDAAIQSLCTASVALGVGSVRAVVLAARTACHAAALAGRTTVDAEDLELAAALVLGPRATQIPMEPDADEQPPEEPPPPEDPYQEPQSDQSAEPDRPLDDVVLAAAAAAIPANLLQHIQSSGRGPRDARTTGRLGARQKSKVRGRPAGTRAGRLKDGDRLNILETLRAAAPWQRIRARTARNVTAASGQRRVLVRSEDFRIKQMKHRSETSTIFVVDASGSSALHRLAEAKGAVEMLLSECYVRRDRVALIAFRGTTAELLLPPTRALARAKRALAGLPGGGATPLASGLDEAVELGMAERKKGKVPTIVVLTDGKGNVARDGTKGRAGGEADALAAGAAFRLSGLDGIVIDTSPQRHPQAANLAGAMGAHYLALPHADAATLSRAVRLTTART